MADQTLSPDKAKGTPVSVPTAPVKAAVKAEPKPVRWKLAKGRAVGITVPGDIIEITNANLNTPSVLLTISRIEAEHGKKLFGTVFIKE